MWNKNTIVSCDSRSTSCPPACLWESWSSDGCSVSEQTVLLHPHQPEHTLFPLGWVALLILASRHPLLCLSYLCISSSDLFSVLLVFLSRWMFRGFWKTLWKTAMCTAALKPFYNIRSQLWSNFLSNYH